MCVSEGWKDRLGHDYAQMVKELMGRGGNQVEKACIWFPCLAEIQKSKNSV